MPTFVSDGNDGLFASHMGFPGPLAWITLCKDNSSLHMGCVLRCACRTLPLTSSRCLPSRGMWKVCMEAQTSTAVGTPPQLTVCPMHSQPPRVVRSLALYSSLILRTRQEYKPTLTWDLPITGMRLFNFSIPSTPSLYNNTVFQAPSLILVSLTMTAVPAPQLNLAEGRGWKGRV